MDFSEDVVRVFVDNNAVCCSLARLLHLAASGGRQENCQTNLPSLSPELCEEMQPGAL